MLIPSWLKMNLGAEVFRTSQLEDKNNSFCFVTNTAAKTQTWDRPPASQVRGDCVHSPTSQPASWQSDPWP